MTHSATQLPNGGKQPVSNKLVIAVVSLAILTFLGILSETSLNIAYSTPMEEFSIGASVVQWLVTGYLLLLSVSIPSSPFMVPVHGGTHDFLRFSPLAHRWLFRHFRQIESGISGSDTAGTRSSVTTSEATRSAYHSCRRARKAATASVREALPGGKTAASSRKPDHRGGTAAGSSVLTGLL